MRSGHKSGDSVQMERSDIEEIMPHAPSWVFVDRVLECNPPAFIRTQKDVGGLDPIVAAHFRNGPALLPGVLLIEYVSQSAYLLGRLTGSAARDSHPIRLLTRCSASFLSPARSGDRLTAEVRLVDCVRETTVYDATVSCEDRKVCRVRIFASPAPGETLRGLSVSDTIAQLGRFCP